MHPQPTSPVLNSPKRHRTLLRIAILTAVFAVLAAAALGQSKPPAVQPSSQGPAQSTPQPTPQPSAQPPAQPPPQTPPPQGAPQPTQQPAPQPSGQPTQYTTPDGTGSVMVPAGWKVTQGGESLIILAGPNTGEAAVLGKVYGAHNAPFVAGQKGLNNTGVSMPWAATFADKVGMIFDQIIVTSGEPIPQGAVTSVTPIPVPRDIGQCGAYSGNLTNAQGQFVDSGSFCSMSLGDMGDFKTIINIVQLPAAESASLPALTQQILSSYNVPINTLEVLLKPWDQPAGHIVLMNPDSSQCFELGVMHLTPPAQLPRACGGSAP